MRTAHQGVLQTVIIGTLIYFSPWTDKLFPICTYCHLLYTHSFTFFFFPSELLSTFLPTFKSPNIADWFWFWTDLKNFHTSICFWLQLPDDKQNKSFNVFLETGQWQKIPRFVSAKCQASRPFADLPSPFFFTYTLISNWKIK